MKAGSIKPRSKTIYTQNPSTPPRQRERKAKGTRKSAVIKSGNLSPGFSVNGKAAGYLQETTRHSPFCPLPLLGQSSANAYPLGGHVTPTDRSVPPPPRGTFAPPMPEVQSPIPAVGASRLANDAPEGKRHFLMGWFENIFSLKIVRKVSLVVRLLASVRWRFGLVGFLSRH